MRRRLDQEMVARALVASRTEAEQLIEAGKVLVGGAPASKASRQVAPGEPILVTRSRRFASRGGDKLAAALEHFDVDVVGRSAIDAGSSTGGFTDCLLQSGARRVAGFDVGRGQLDQSLRDDPRVVQTDGFNIRHLEAGTLPFPCSLGVIDVSFISLRLVAGPVLGSLSREDSPHGDGRWDPECVMLVKPQFEATRREVSRGSGVIRDGAIHDRVCAEVVEHVMKLGWSASEPIRSPLTGGSGNVEFLLHVRSPQPMGEQS